MLGKDFNSNPYEYRHWIVDEPDFNADLYSGLKSGDNDFQTIDTFIVLDDGYSVDFNFPDGYTVINTKKVLPEAFAKAKTAIIDGYVYLFGGYNSAKIYRAKLDNPCDFEYTEYDLPRNIYGYELAIINDIIYIFGGVDGYDGYATDYIMSAPKNDPLTWTDHGSKLPDTLTDSHLAIVDGYLYLIGGQNSTNWDAIYKADINDPFTWSIDGYLPGRIKGSHLAVYNGYVYLFGGASNIYTATDTIIRANLSDLTTWEEVGTLSNPTAYGNIVVLGSQLFIYGGWNNSKNILQSNDGINWTTYSSLPYDLVNSQIAIIYDRIYFYGGNGNSRICCTKQKNKFSFTNEQIALYALKTRLYFDLIYDPWILFQLLGFSYWNTDFGQ